MTPEQAVETLNRWLAFDPATITTIFNARHRVRPEACKLIIDDPTLVCGGDNDDDVTLGPLGFVNGLVCMPEHGKRIAALYENKDGTGVILRFELVDLKRDPDWTDDRTS